MISDKLATVAQWNNVVEPTQTALQAIFNDVTLFTNVYIPVKTPTAQGMPEEFTYTNIGLNPIELANAYLSDYGEQYLIADYSKGAWLPVKLRVDSILTKNKGKYLKLIELSGYSYNPLWNVDGVETETQSGKVNKHIDESYIHGETITTERDASDTSTSQNSNTTTTSYTGQSSDYADVTSFDIHGSVVDPSNPSTGEERTRQYIPKDRVIHDKSKETETITDTHSASDTSKHDATYTDKHTGTDQKTGDPWEEDNRTIERVRHGNIGVTKTQELIESERVNLRFNVIDEFFRDINKDILCRVFTKDVFA